MPRQATVEHGKRLRVITGAADDWTPALKQIGLYMTRQVALTFDNQRRGKHRWPPRGVPNVMGILSDLERGQKPPARRFRARKAGQDTGKLQGSISFRIISDVEVEVGTRVQYAQQFASGGTRTKSVTAKMKERLAEFLDAEPGRRAALGWMFNVRQVKITVPRRPFVFFAKQDLQAINQILADHIKGKKATGKK